MLKIKNISITRSVDARKEKIVAEQAWEILQKAFDPGGKYLLIFNLGKEEGVLHKGWLTFGRKIAFTIKDYIDRKFITRFQ